MISKIVATGEPGGNLMRRTNTNATNTMTKQCHSDDVACRDETLVACSINYALKLSIVMALFRVICRAYEYSFFA